MHVPQARLTEAHPPLLPTTTQVVFTHLKFCLQEKDERLHRRRDRPVMVTAMEMATVVRSVVEWLSGICWVRDRRKTAQVAGRVRTAIC